MQAADSEGEELRPRLQAEGATADVEVEHAEVACGDGLLQQALWNLLDNSLKYRRSGVAPHVELSGRVNGARYELRISDNGLGMSPEESSHVFEPFFRSDRTRDRPGTGLGLSIVKRVVEASGGTVTVTSVPGKGTTFYLRLRRTEPAHP